MKLSPFTIFWIAFYALATIGLLAPNGMAKWFADALAAPGVALTAAIVFCILVALPGTAWRLWSRLLKSSRSTKHE